MNNQREEAYVKDYSIALLGVGNGIFAEELIWPFLVIGILRLVLQSNYDAVVDEHYVMMSLLVSLLVSLITLGVSILIAGPKRLLKAFSKLGLREWKYIALTVAAIFAFNYIYNFILVIAGVDIDGGSKNQQIVDSYILQVPVLSLLSMVIIAPLSEEMTFRYFIYGGVRKWNRKAAIIISGVVFMLAHGIAAFVSKDADIVRELLMLPPYLFSGMALAYAYDRTDNLGVSISAHLLNNAISFLLTLILI